MTNKMTDLQKDTVEQLKNRVLRLNRNQNVTVHNIRKSHIALFIGNTRETLGGELITTTTFVDVEVNTKGNITKGYCDFYTPKVKKEYPYKN